jgi:hypothetical protein
VIRIALNLSGGRFFLWFGAAFLAIGLAFLYAGMQDATRERAYQEQGEVVAAVVVEKSIKRASREGNTSTRYEIAYRFTAADGRTVQGVDAVGVDEWERLAPGSPFKITYLPGAPETSRAEGSGDTASPYLMMGMGSLFALIGGVLFVRTAARLRRERRLLREGLTAQGTVLAIEPTNVAVNRVRQWAVRYRYRDPSGRDHEATSGALPPKEARAVAVGDTIEARFDRERPEQSLRVRSQDPAGAAAGLEAAQSRPSFWRWLLGVVAVLGVLFAALVVGELVPALKELDQLAARHEFLLGAITIGITVIGFALFIGGILYRIFGGEGEPMTHAEVEDLSRDVGMDARPAAARFSAYRFRGWSAGASVHEEFNLKEAKEAWRQGAWRTSPRWRANIVVTAGALLFTLGLFGFFVVSAPVGIKLLYVAVILYAAVRMIVAFTRA